jgi:hypothetical protein
MSENEALARFHCWCSARHRKVETRQRWRSCCVMHAIRIPLLRQSRIYTSARAVDLRIVTEL